MALVEERSCKTCWHWRLHDIAPSLQMPILENSHGRRPGLLCLPLAIIPAAWFPCCENQDAGLIEQIPFDVLKTWQLTWAAFKQDDWMDAWRKPLRYLQIKDNSPQILLRRNGGRGVRFSASCLQVPQKLDGGRSKMLNEDGAWDDSFFLPP